MFDWLTTLSPVTQALVGGLFTWTVTALGAALALPTRVVPMALWMPCWASPPA